MVGQAAMSYAKVRAILDAATKPPWYYEPQSGILSARVGSEGHRRGVGDFAIFGIPEHVPVDEWDMTDPAHPDADARAIVVSRNLAPALLAVAEAAEWAVDYIRRHGGVDNDYHDIERATFADAALAALDAEVEKL